MAENAPIPGGSPLSCPFCGKPLDGAPELCPSCGADLRVMGSGNDTLASAIPAERAAEPQIAAGTIVDRRYRVVEKLGEGAMGAVYKVEHVLMGKIMALKLMRAGSTLDRDAVKRFRQEAQLVSKLSGANTVSVFDFGELPDGTLFMVMEYVPGRDLARVLEAEGALPEARAASVCRQVLRSLAEAHDAGIVHRDVKPANVMLLKTREGEDFVKLLDFGVAKLAEKKRDSGRKSTGVDIAGTPLYMSPEQATGEPLDARSDLYSVGAMLFELVTGKPVFDGASPFAIIARHVSEKPPKARQVAPNRAISDELEAVLAKALAKDPNDRYQSADEMRAALGGSRQSLNLSVLPSGLEIAQRGDWDSFERSLRRRRWAAPLLTVLVLGGLAGAGAWHYTQKQAEEAAKKVRSKVTAEAEPNDALAQASLIDPGVDVQGAIKRLSREKPDIDLYEFTVPGPGPSRANLSVTGVPGVNLELGLFGPIVGTEGGRLPSLAQVDDRFLGGGERMSDLTLEPGRYIVRVGDKRRADEPPGPPRDNAMEPYGVRVDLSAPSPFPEAEPNNLVEQSTKVSSARVVFGHAGARGEATQVTTASGASATMAGFWSDDFYEAAVPKGATTVCALLSGVPGATLALSLFATERPRILALPSPAEREKALDEHLKKLGRDKPARVVGGQVEKKCARAAESANFKVSVAEGESSERYVLAVIDDGPEGFAGLLAACDELITAGGADECKGLLAKAIEALPLSKGAAKAKAKAAAVGAP